METLPEVIADLTGPLGGLVWRGLPESNIIAQLDGSLREIRDTWWVTKEATVGIVPELWSEWGLVAEGDPHDAVTTNSRKEQYKLGKLVIQGRHAAHTALLEQLPETARPPGPDGALGGGETKAFAKARYRILHGAGAIACLRARPTDSLRVNHAAEFVSMGRRLIGIGENVAVK